MKQYWIETYGCQMNKAESESLELMLGERGWESAQDPLEAELIILNTCSVRKTAEDRIWGRLGFYKPLKARRDFRLVLMGCMAERLKSEILNRAPHIDILVGNFQKHRLLDFIEKEAGRRELRIDPGEYHFSDLHYTSGFQAFVPIMHGCDNLCTYCVVPYVRGPEVSRSVESIMLEVSRLDSASVREITLLGQNVNSYCYSNRGGDGGLVRFPDLLKVLVKKLDRIEWVRFLTSHPKDFSEALIELIGGERAICRHIHLPVQHGSDRILMKMGRGYSRGRYLKLIDRIKKRLGEVSLTTDILIGFPGETEADFRKLLELMREVEFDDAFTYRYNPREGTRAFQLEDSVTDAEKQERLTRIIELQRAISRKRKTKKLGKSFKVLVEGVSRKNKKELLGRTESNEMVVFPASGEKIGHFVRVGLISINGNTFVGKEDN